VTILHPAGERDHAGDGHHHGADAAGHDHDHEALIHTHVSPANASRRKLATVLGLSATILIAEVIGGVLSGSLALLADAGHVLTDMSGIAMAYVAISFAARPASAGRTFGYLRVEILAALGNAVLLLGVGGFVLVEAIERFFSPHPIESGLMGAVAGVGLIVNLASLFVLQEAQKHSLNMRGAYLEVLGDVVGSAAVIVAALVIALSGWVAADVVASVAIAVLIVPRTISLLREVTNVLLESTPRGVELEEVRRHILDAPGVIDCHDLHAWTITSGSHVVSAHVVLADGADPGAALDALSRCLSDDFDIEHSTFQLESSDRRRLEQWSHA
jgi:cobalt-zinc-cadmium efflux system protein